MREETKCVLYLSICIFCTSDAIMRSEWTHSQLIYCYFTEPSRCVYICFMITVFRDRHRSRPMCRSAGVS